MSLIPYSIPLSRVVTTSGLLKAASALRPIANVVWANREMFGDALASGKQLVSKLLTSSQKKKKKSKRISTNSDGVTSDRSLIAPQIGPYQYGSISAATQIQRGIGQSRVYSSENGMRMVGSLQLCGVGKFLVNTSLNNTFCFADSSASYSPGANAYKTNQGRFISPVGLVVDSTGVGVGRLSSFAELYQKFRFHHLHFRYIPQLGSGDSNHDILMLTYATDASVLDNFSFSTTSGTGFTQVDASNFPNNVASPTWFPFDLEVNFASPDWFYTDPESGTIDQTSDSYAANVRMANQGVLIGTWGRNSSSLQKQLGTIYLDYVVDFADPSFVTPDVTLSLEERRSGWHPSDQGSPTPSASQAAPSYQPKPSQSRKQI